MKKTILIIIIFLQFGKVEAQGNVGLQIIGNWNITNINSEGDEVLSTTKWIFLNDGICNVYIDNQLMQSYFYTITNTECDSGLIDNENFHLKLQSTSDQKLVECYIFMGFANIDGSQTLSLLAYGATDPILFVKVHSNTYQFKDFIKNDCGTGNIGSDEIYTVAAGTYFSTVSQDDANIKAKDDIKANGQKYANEVGYCTYYNVAKTGGFVKINCPRGMYGTNHYYSVPAGSYTSDVSQADADELAQSVINSNGQNYANSVGTCFYKSNEKSGNYTRNNCAPGGVGSSVLYRVLFGKYTSTISQADADKKASDDLIANGQNYANANGTCVFKSKALTKVFIKNNCTPPKVGSSVTYSVAAGAFTSTVSQADADAKAQAAGQANANTRGTCK